MNEYEINLINQTITKLKEALKVLKDLQDGIEATPREVYEIQKYLSKSGNVTWKCSCEDGETVYIRQAMRPYLENIEIWVWLNTLELDSVYSVMMKIETLPDGDFHKITNIKTWQRRD